MSSQTHEAIILVAIALVIIAGLIFLDSLLPLPWPGV